MAEQEKPAHISTDRARAGTTPGVTRYVLAVSLLLVVVIFAIILLV
ncbi:hypothetical protein ACX40Y_15825 [Sphingomonas sp. RS6]